ncbi:MAG TPA: SprT-like domain-containing protein [Tepidisphaeraceae bacterium]|nr:SprT-like domain-containing protein [Tepidisphaeraceae bacterium]
MHLTDARDLAVALMKRHGLDAAGWRFRFDHARRRFGCCKFSEKAITLSRPLTLLNPSDQVRDTILHEIAHALTPGDGHGRKWRAACVRVGANPRRCYSDDEVVSPPRRPVPYRYGCRACGWWVDRRRVMRGRKYVCAKCRGPVVYEAKSSLNAVAG